MSAPRFGRFQKTTALVPLALLSAAVTASLTGVGPATTAVAGEQRPATLPDGTSVPDEAIEAPASVSRPGAGVVAPGLGAGLSGERAIRDASAASVDGIPAAALAAYQRAETVINAADESCHMPWQLVAAIGRVESDHGRANGNTLDDDGLARPGIFGIALDGSNNTQAISDTDAGQYDSDAKWDRAVGPMQFIPSTWSVVGVDGDNDGERNPQDIDDAALSSAVYLCSGKDDLSGTAGQRSAVYRYNHSDSYVDLVLAYMNAYMSGEFTSVPNSVTSSYGIGSSSGFDAASGGGLNFFTPTPEPRGGKKGGKNGGGKKGGKSGGTNGGGNGGSGTDPVPDTPTDGDTGSDGGIVPDLGLPEVDLPGTGGGGSGGGGGGNGGGGSGGGGGTGGGGSGGGGGGGVGDVLSKADAIKQCLNQVGASTVASIPVLKKPDYLACLANLGFG